MEGLSAPIEAASWCIIAAALGLYFVALTRRALQEQQALGLGVCVVVALILRLVVPFAPVNWYVAVNDAQHLAAFSRPTAYTPLPLRALVFDFGFGAMGARAFNLATGVACIPLFWYVARLAACSSRVALLFAALFTVIPMYVRYAATDTSHCTILLLYALAAVAYLRIASRQHTAFDYLALVLAVALGMPIRLESGVLFLSIPFFAFRGTAQWPPLRRHLPLVVACVVATALGAAGLWQFHAESLQMRAAIQPPSALIALIARTTFLVNPAGPAFFPALFAVPVWFYVAGLWRRRAWPELRQLYLPVYFGCIPSLFGDGPFVSLPIAGYHIVSLIFVVFAIARAIDALWDRFVQLLRSHPPRRLALGIAAIPCIWVFFWTPYRYTYAWQEEYAFLTRVLPHKQATVLTIWDEATHGGDLDCCLALPYPTFLIDRPNLRWLVLNRSDLTDDRLRHLQFDYYYPGSMASLAPDSLQRGWARAVAGSPERVRRQRAHIEMIAQLDARVRQIWPLVADQQATVPAHTFSAAAFKDDRVALTLYRHVAKTGN